MILVFGQTGQVGRELAQLPDVHCVGREEADLNNEASIRDAIRKFSPQAIINAAAYTACLLYTSPSPRDGLLSRMPSSA